VHIKNNEGVDTLSEQGVNVSTHERNQVVELATLLGELLLHGVLVALGDLLEDVLDGEGPPDLGAHESNLTNLGLNPVNSVLLGIVVGGPLGENLQRVLHLVVNLAHELLNLALEFDGAL
jgi:NAD-dependent oxidoreductase involved in siderophore biosynthesis